MEPMRPDEHPGAKALDDVAYRVALEDRVEVLDLVVRAETIETESTARGHRHRAGLVTPDECPDALSVNVDMHGGWRPHLPPARQPCPVSSGNAGAASVGESLHGAVRIGQPALR